MNIPLENNAEQFYRTLSSIGDGVITSDLQGNICFLNKTAEELTGFNRDEALGNKLHHVFRIRIKEDTEPEDNPFQRALDSRRTVGLKRNTVLVTKQGEEKFVSASHSPIKDNNGDITGVVVVFRDITSIRKAEDALQRAKDAAESPNRAKSKFLANMSHEIRTPLNGIIGMTDLTLLTELTPEQRENLSIVKNCAEALMNVIQDILDFSKIEAGKMTMDCVEFDIDTLMSKMLKAHRVNAHEKGLALEYRKSGDVPEILRGDPFRLQQILNNLLGNAIKFTDFGSVGLEIEAVKKEKQTLKHIPIVAVTAFALQGDKERFLAAGMDDYLSKPIKMNELFEMIDKYVKGVSKDDVPHKEKIDEEVMAKLCLAQ